MKKDKVFLFSAACVLGVAAVVTFGCKKLSDEKMMQNQVIQEQSYEVTSYITDDMKAKTSECNIDLCLNTEYTPESIGKDADAIVIASVISLDNAKANFGLFGGTYGKILISEIYKGDLSKGQVVEYVKNGGVMSMKDWESTQPENANKKRAYLREQSGEKIDLENTYIDVQIMDDVKIEEGLTYLMYLKENNGKYEIIGLDTGLRQVNTESGKQNRVKVQNIDGRNTTLQILNNKTGEYESLQNYINEYIDNSDIK